MAFLDLIPMDKNKFSSHGLPDGGDMGRRREVSGGVSGMILVIGMDIVWTHEKDKLREF